MSEILSATPMEAKASRTLPEGAGWWYEPKWDGFRCLAFKVGDRVELIAKSGKSLNRFFPEVVERLRAVEAARFGLDGELLARDGDQWSFEVLQARLHPADSRIRRLAAETPATFAVFDMLVSAEGADLRAEPLIRRRENLKAFTRANGDARLTLSPGTGDLAQAQAWLDGSLLEGVVAKRLDGPYGEGRRDMVKVKRLRRLHFGVRRGRPRGADRTARGARRRARLRRTRPRRPQPLEHRPLRPVGAAAP